MNINTLAEQMKERAANSPVNLAQMMKNIADLKFPVDLKQIVEVDGYGMMHVQFSHDLLSEGKYIEHLSFSREDMSPPTEEMSQTFRMAFFGNDPILPLPSMHQHVVQMGKLVVKNSEAK